MFYLYYGDWRNKGQTTFFWPVHEGNQEVIGKWECGLAHCCPLKKRTSFPRRRESSGKQQLLHWITPEIKNIRQ